MTDVNLNGWEPIENAPHWEKHGDTILVGFQGQFYWVMFVAIPNGKNTSVLGYAKPTHYYAGIKSPTGLKFVPQ